LITTAHLKVSPGGKGKTAGEAKRKGGRPNCFPSPPQGMKGKGKGSEPQVIKKGEKKGVR